MSSVKGTFQNGVARPLEPVSEEREGQEVIITFLGGNGETQASAQGEKAWDTLTELLDKCTVDTGIPDLAHQHDHYLYGKPKKD